VGSELEYFLGRWELCPELGLGLLFGDVVRSIYSLGCRNFGT
jgi:hypothetical protein